MEKKRIGNDIKLRWAVYEPDGHPVDFNGKSVKVEVRHSQLNKKYPQEVTIDGNLIDLQFTAEEQSLVGIYNLWLRYTYPDPSVEGGIATVTLDNCNAFELAAKSCQLAGINEDPIYLEGVVTGLSYSNLTESEKQEITERLLDNPRMNTIKGDSAYQVAVNEGFQGTAEEWLQSLHGEDFTYEDFTAEQIEELQLPAIEAGEQVKEQVNSYVETKDTQLNVVIDNVYSAATLAGAAAEKAEEEAEKAKQAGEVVTGAEAGRQAKYEGLELVAANALLEDAGKIQALIEFIINSVYEKITVGLLNVTDLRIQGARMFLSGTTAPGTPPEFIGQVYINTVGKIAYTATGVASVADWKQQ